MKFLLWLWPLLFVGAAACSSDDDRDANEVALGYVWGSINQGQDPERLRQLMTEDLRQETSDAELADAIFCFPTGVLDILLSQDVERNGSTATITATYSLSNPLEGGDDARTVERVWQFERVQDGWLLSDLPSCTFDATG